MQLRLSGLFLAASLFIISGCDDNDKLTLTNPFSISTSITIKVGDILYDKLDASIDITGYSASNVPVYSNTYAYSAQSHNVIHIEQRCDYYRISVDKWGVFDEKVFTYDALFARRKNGPYPETVNFGGEIQPKKLLAVVYHHALNVDGSLQLQPQVKQTFHYGDEGLLDRIEFFNYHIETATYELTRTHDLQYVNNRVNKILGFQPEKEHPYIEEVYHYLTTGNIEAIIINNQATGINTTVNFTYYESPEKVSAYYSNSSGPGFDYSFEYHSSNIVHERTTRGGQLCNEGSFGYDRNINPFRHLGFVDFNLENLSINNKVTENINYLGCSFPDLRVQSYEYTYNSLGYPLTKTIHYTSGGRSECHFTYQD